MIPVSKPYIGDEETNAVVEVLKSGMIAQGLKTKELEEMFAKFCNAKHAIATSNGTTALHAALIATGFKDGDEAITVPFTFVATANPVLMERGKVVFVDIAEDDFCIDPQKVAEKISDKTKLIIPVDLYGQVYKYKEIKKLTEGKEIKILEDACQAVGAEQDGIRAGNFGDVSAFSLYATKNITTAEGGMIVTNDDEIARKAKIYRHHGQDEAVTYEYLELGNNYRMTDIAAAIGVEQMKKVEYITNARIKNAELLTEGLSNVKGLILPSVMDGNTHVYHQYTIRITDEFGHSRDELKEFLKENEIGSGVYYPKPLHLHEHFRKMGYKEGDFPVSEKLSKQVLSLPVNPHVKDEDIKKIIDKIIEFSKK